MYIILSRDIICWEKSYDVLYSVLFFSLLRNEFRGDYNFRMVLETQVILFNPILQSCVFQFLYFLLCNLQQKQTKHTFCFQPKKVANPDWIVSAVILFAPTPVLLGSSLCFVELIFFSDYKCV